MRDHPRMRGEHIDRMCIFPLTEGSSPHARGAHPIDLRTILQVGIIPACAGSTRLYKTMQLKGGDHPRMRGEHTSRPARLVNILA